MKQLHGSPRIFFLFLFHSRPLHIVSSPPFSLNSRAELSPFLPLSLTFTASFHVSLFFFTAFLLSFVPIIRGVSSSTLSFSATKRWFFRSSRSLARDPYYVARTASLIENNARYQLLAGIKRNSLAGETRRRGISLFSFRRGTRIWQEEGKRESNCTGCTRLLCNGMRHATEHFLHCASGRRVVEYFIPCEAQRSMIDVSRALIRKEAARRVYFGARLSPRFWRMVPRKLMTQWCTSRNEIGKGGQKCHFFDETVESG